MTLLGQTLQSWHSGRASANCARLREQRPIDPYGQRVRLHASQPLTSLPLIAVGGVLGSLGRFALELALPWSGGLPWATLVVNLVGALAIGVVATSIATWRPWIRPFAITGVLGGFTTFSALALQTGVLLDGGHAATAAVYVAVTIAGGLLAVAAGAALGPRVNRAMT